MAAATLQPAAGAAGELTVWRAGWQSSDPSRISSSLGSVGNALGGSLVRWDSIHYLQIAAHGYTQFVNTSFFPLYPLLTAGLGGVVGSNVLAGVLISLAAFAVGLVLLHRLTSIELGQGADLFSPGHQPMENSGSERRGGGGGSMGAGGASAGAGAAAGAAGWLGCAAASCCPA